MAGFTVMVRQAVKVAGVDGIALTKLDVLDGLENLIFVPLMA